MENANMWLVLLDKAILPLAVLFLTPVLSALANRMIAAIQEKTKVELTKQQREALDQILNEAIHFAEEQAHKSIKEKTGELSGSSKMEKAIDYIQTKGKVLSLDDVAQAKSEELASLIEAKLFQKRIDDAEPSVKKPAQLS